LLLSLISLDLLQAVTPALKVNYLGLNWLHWGWAFAAVPQLAAYVGSVGTAALLHRWEPETGEEAKIQPGLVAIAFGGLLLIGRAIFAANVPVHQLGLALGILGWSSGWLGQRSHRAFGHAIGIALMLVGWLATASVIPPWQAISIGGLAASLFWQRLQQHWRQKDLLVLLSIGLVSFGLAWWCFPWSWRLTLMKAMQNGGIPPADVALAGLWLFLYLWLALAFARYLRQREQPQLVKITEQFSLIVGLAVSVVAIWHPLVRSLYFSFGFATLVATLFKRRQIPPLLAYLTQIAGIAALLSWISWFFPNLEQLQLAFLLLALAIALWSFCAFASPNLWQKSSWHLGLGLAAWSYGLLLEHATMKFDAVHWGLYWLLIPTALILLSFRPNFAQPRLTAGLGIVAVLAAQTLTVWRVQPFLVSLGVGTILLVLASQKLHKFSVARLAVGFGLIFSGIASQQLFRANFDFFLWAAIALIGLAVLRDIARAQRPLLAQTYAIAFENWGAVLATITLCIMSIAVVFNGFGWINTEASLPGITRAALLITLVIGFLYVWRRPSNLGFYGLAWAFELFLAAQALQIPEQFTFLAAANVVVGLVAQQVGDRTVRRMNPDSTAEATFPFSSWHIIPILFAGLGCEIAHREFTATTGLYTLATGLTIVGVGRRKAAFKPLTFLGLLTISGGAFELLMHWLSQFEGGQIGDGFAVLTWLAGAIAIVYLLFNRWLSARLRLEQSQLDWVAHLHWFAGSGLSLFALSSGFSSTGTWLWIGAVVVLAAYAAWQGRTQPIWVYLGFAQLGLASHVLVGQVLESSVLAPWGGAIAALAALGVYNLPWRRWGWSSQAWKISSVFLPGAIVLLTYANVNIPSLLLAAAVYAWFARTANQIRLSYVSVLLADWAFLKFFAEWKLTEPIWFVALVTASLLFVAQVDPVFQPIERKEQRHWLRCLAIALFCLTALYQSDGRLWYGFLVILLGIGLVLAGLMLRIRAFLYVGTLTFVLKLLRQLWLYINDNSLLLWALGIVVGLLLIWIAATFEARRSQAIAVLRHWASELEIWE